MRFKRRSSLVTCGISGTIVWSLLLLLSSCNCSAVQLDSPSFSVGAKLTNFNSVVYRGLFLVGIVSVSSIHQIHGSALPHQNLSTQNLTKNYEARQPPTIDTSSTHSQNGSVPLPPASLPEDANLHFNNSDAQPLYPRRLTKLPKSRNSKYSRNSQQAPDSAKNRARLLLGTLSRQNCFAKVLCGLGARPPSTKTDLLNDYVYLMEELMVDDDDPKDPSPKGKKNKNKNKKPYPKNDKDDSDSSQSKSDEKDKGTDKYSDWGFLADEELAAEDPQVLKYMKLEEKKRQHKDSLPADFLIKRRGRIETENMTKLHPSLLLHLPPESTRKIARNFADAVKTGRTFTSSRQCRTIMNRCPFDDTQMNEIVGNLKKLMQGKGQDSVSSSKTTTTVTASGNSNGKVTAITSPQGSGSKVEIILHLNQNGMPYAGYQMPMQFNPSAPGVSISQVQPGVANMPVINISSPANAAPQSYTHAMMSQFMTPGPQLQAIPSTQATTAPAPTASTTSTTAPDTSTTTVRTPGEEQLLDFLYGVVNFNESETQTPELLEAPPNPYWSLANSALQGFDDMEQKLKLKPNPDEEADDLEDSSEEVVELKKYLLSLKETLQGLAQMNNATLAVEQKVVKSSEEETSSAEDPLDDTLPLPGIVETEADTEEDGQPDKDKEVTLKGKKKKKKAKPTSPSFPALIASKKPAKLKPESDGPLFDDDNEENEDLHAERGNQNRPGDDEYEPEDNSASAENNGPNNEDSGQDDLNDQSDERPSNPFKPKRNKPQKIKLKFEPISVDKDPDELSDKEKRKLMALSNVLLPPVPDTPPASKDKKPVKDVVQEIRYPTIRPVANEFQNIGKIVKSSAIINIDEFAENSGKNPKFPKRKYKGKRPYRLNYQTKRRPAATRPVQKEDNVNSNSESSEETYDDDDEPQPFLRGDVPSSSNSSRGKPPMSDHEDNDDDNGPLLSRPVHHFHQYPPPEQSDSFDLFGSVMNIMGMKPVESDLPNRTPPQAGPSYPMGYFGEVPMHIPGSLPPHYPMTPKEKPKKSKNREKSDLPAPTPTPEGAKNPLPLAERRPEPKIAISVPLASEFPAADIVQDDKGDTDDKKKKGKDKDKDKDKKDGGKKNRKKQEKKNKKKKDGGGSTGFSTQFHQQVYPAKEQGQGIWSKIKGFVENIGQTSSGETPFIHLGFSESDPLDGAPHAASNEHVHKPHIGPPPHHHGPYDHSEEEEEEEDDLADDVGDDEDNEDEDDHDKSTSIEEEVEDNDNEDENKTDNEDTPPNNGTQSGPDGNPLGAQPTPVNPLAIVPTRGTIAPKPPKYKVNRDRIQNKNIIPKSTAGPPVILFRSTTLPPPPTIRTTSPPLGNAPKPPKRRIVYKPPAKRIKNVPGAKLNPVTTARTTTFRPQLLEPGSHSREEDDEKEPLSHFFQPGPKGQNVRGRPPIPIDAFHMQSEDMLIDSQEDKFRTGVKDHPYAHFPDDSQSHEDSEDDAFLFPDSVDEIRRRILESDLRLKKSAMKKPIKKPPTKIEIENDEETRGSKRGNKNKNRRRQPGPFRHDNPNNSPQFEYPPNEEQGPQSGITGAVMKSPIFSNHFKHLYTKFQSFLMPSMPYSNRPSGY